MSRKSNREEGERREPIEAFSGSGIDEIDGTIKISLRDASEVTAVGEEETQKPVGIFIGSSLPWLMGFGEENRGVKQLLQHTQLSKFGAIIEGKIVDRQTIEGVKNSLAGGSGVL